jgi:hypothetical protein
MPHCLLTLLRFQLLQWTYFLNHRKTRWVSGAQDIMFTNPCAEPGYAPQGFCGCSMY